MGRRRKNNIELPMYMTYRHGAYHFRKDGKSKILSRSKKEAFYEYNKIMFPAEPSSYSYYAHQYLSSEHHLSKSENSKKNDLLSFKRTTYTFQQFNVCSIMPHHVKKYMTERAKTSKDWANKDKSFISNVLQLAVDTGEINSNPCREVKNIRITPRKRLIKDEEFSAMLMISPFPLNYFMRLMFCLVERPSDILRIKVEDIKGDGIKVYTKKVDRKTIVAWSPELREIIAFIISKRSNKCSQYLFSRSKGYEHYKLSALQSMFSRSMKKALNSGVLKERFSLYDIRAYALTTVVKKEGFAEAAKKAGHSTEKMVRQVYFRGDYRKDPAHRE